LAQGIVLLIILLLHQVEDIAEDEIAGALFPARITVRKELLPELLRQPRKVAKKPPLQLRKEIFRGFAFP
jgi:hypothetical protein